MKQIAAKVARELFNRAIKEYHKQVDPSTRVKSIPKRWAAEERFKKFVKSGTRSPERMKVLQKSFRDQRLPKVSTKPVTLKERRFQLNVKGILGQLRKQPRKSGKGTLQFVTREAVYYKPPPGKYRDPDPGRLKQYLGRGPERKK